MSQEDWRGQIRRHQAQFRGTSADNEQDYDDDRLDNEEALDNVRHQLATLQAAHASLEADHAALQAEQAAFAAKHAPFSQLSISNKAGDIAKAKRVAKCIEHAALLHRIKDPNLQKYFKAENDIVRLSRFLVTAGNERDAILITDRQLMLAEQYYRKHGVPEPDRIAQAARKNEEEEINRKATYMKELRAAKKAAGKKRTGKRESSDGSEGVNDTEVEGADNLDDDEGSVQGGSGRTSKQNKAIPVKSLPSRKKSSKGAGKGKGKARQVHSDEDDDQAGMQTSRSRRCAAATPEASTSGLPRRRSRRPAAMSASERISMGAGGVGMEIDSQ